MTDRRGIVRGVRQRRKAKRVVLTSECCGDRVVGLRWRRLMSEHRVGQYSRRDFGKLALATVPVASLFGGGGLAFALQSKPNSVWGGVPFGIFAPYRLGTRGIGSRGRAQGAREVRREPDRAGQCRRGALRRRAAGSCAVAAVRAAGSPATTGPATARRRDLSLTRRRSVQGRQTGWFSRLPEEAGVDEGRRRLNRPRLRARRLTRC